MESSTLFLLQFFGPVFLVIGCSLLLYRDRYVKMVLGLREFNLSYYFAAVLPLCAGLAIVLTHNRWETVPEVLVSLIGWMGLVKGLVRLIAPDFTKSMIKKLATLHVMSISALVLLVWGGYMAWMGYFFF